MTVRLHMLNPTSKWRESIEEFLEEIEAEVSVVDSPVEADVVIDWPDEKLASEPNRLHSGGSMTCPNAFAAAAKLRISRYNMGRLLNLLDAKITGCQLGCFK